MSIGGKALDTASSLVTKPLKKAFKVSTEIAANAPGTTALTLAPIGMLAAMPKAPNVAKNQANHSIGRSSMRLIGRGREVRASARAVSQEDLDLYMRISGKLEKTASFFSVPAKKELQEIIGDTLQAQGKKQKKMLQDLISEQKKANKPGLRDRRMGGEHGFRLQDVALAGLALGGAGAVAGFGGQVIGIGAGELGDLKHRMGRGRHYGAMMKADPELRQYKPAEIKRVFNVIHRSSPYVSKEPLLAASTVRSIMDTPRATHGSKTPTVSTEAIKRILELETGRQGTRYPFMQNAKGRPDGNTGVSTSDMLG
jgi:hypothetical protein